jgi:DNA-binding SARP family transcriptional activator
MHLGEAGAALDWADRARELTGPLHRLLAEGARLQALWYLGQVEAVRDALPGLVDRMARAGHRNYTALAAAHCCEVLAQGGDGAGAAVYLARARAAAATPDTPLVATNLALAEAWLAVAAGDEAGATTVLRAHLERQPLGAGHSAAPYQRSLVPIYVLVPETRPVWDDADLGPAFRPARQLASWLVAVREHGALPADATPLPDATALLPHVPLRWSAALALAALNDGRADGWRLLEQLGPAARAAVATAGRAHPALERAARTALTGLAAPPSTTLELRLLGPIELWRDGAAVVSVDWRRERVRLLLAYLALHGSVSRTHLADELWPGLRPDAQSRNLRVNLTHLLRVLEPDRAPRAPSFFVRQAAGRLALHPGGRLTVDLWAFDDEAARATDADRRGAAAVGLRHALRAVELWRDEPTDLLSQPWALIDVERCRSRFGSLAVRAGELLLAQGSPDGAQALADRALATDPWSEAAHRLLVAAHRAGGDDVAARRALTRYRVAMDEIGVEPDEATLMVERLVDVSLRSRGP